MLGGWAGPWEQRHGEVTPVRGLSVAGNDGKTPFSITFLRQTHTDLRSYSVVRALPSLSYLALSLCPPTQLSHSTPSQCAARGESSVLGWGSPNSTQSICERPRPWVGQLSRLLRSVHPSPPCKCAKPVPASPSDAGGCPINARWESSALLDLGRLYSIFFSPSLCCSSKERDPNPILPHLKALCTPHHAAEPTSSLQPRGSGRRAPGPV